MPDPVHSPLQPVRTATAGAHELRVTIAETRARLRDVLHDRSRTTDDRPDWHGPHRAQWDHDSADLQRAGRSLDATLSGLLAALDAEIAATTR